MLIPIRIRGTCAELGIISCNYQFSAKLPIKITYFLTAEPIFTPGAKILHQQTPLIEIYPHTHPHLDQRDLCRNGYWVRYHFEQLSAHIKITDKNYLF